MAEIPVDHDPFSAQAEPSGGSAVAIDHDPFTSERTGFGPAEGRQPWSFAFTLANAGLLGQAPKVQAGIETAAESLAGGIPEGLSYKLEAPGVISQYQPMDFWSRYQRNLGRIESDRAAYNVANPLAPLVELGGTIAPTMGIAGAVPGLEALAARGLGGRMLAGEATGTIAGAVGTPITGGDLGQNMSTGTLVGAALPVAGAAVKGAILPAIDPQVASAAQGASALGVNLRPTQLAMSSLAQKADKLFASGYNAGQLKDFTRAVSKTIGADTPVLNQAALDSARDSIRGGFDQIALATPRMQYDQTLHQAFKNAASQLVGVDPAGQKQVKDVLSHLVQTFNKNGGWIDGNTFQKLTQYKGPIGNLAAGGHPMVKKIGGELSDAMLDLLQRNAPVGTADRLAELKTQWGNARAIEGAVQSAGPAGLIDPKKIFAATGKAKPGDLRTLGQVGPFMPSPEVTGTATVPGTHGLKFMDLAKVGGLMAEGYAAIEHPEAALAAAGLAGGALAVSRGIGATLSSAALRKAALARALATPGAGSSLERLGVAGATGAVNMLGGSGE